MHLKCMLSRFSGLLSRKTAMTSPISNFAQAFPATGVGSSGALGAPRGSGAASFAEALKGAVGEVSRLQNDATAAVEQLQLGQTDDVTGVMSAVEKSELALKTLIAIRSKLVSAYDEIRNMPI